MFTLCFIVILSACKDIADNKNTNILVGTGIASWYGPGFQGNLTASGKKYDMGKYTAAHRELKFGTILRITNIKNNLSVNVKVNDRGPFNHKRKIDLSKKAAEEIKMINSGLANVKIELIGYEHANFENLYIHYLNLLIINAAK